MGHSISECSSDTKKFFRWGKAGNMVDDCKHKIMICFNYGEEGHISTQCQKLKEAQFGGKVFALARNQPSFNCYY